MNRHLINGFPIMTVILLATWFPTHIALTHTKQTGVVLRIRTNLAVLPQILSVVIIATALLGHWVLTITRCRKLTTGHQQNIFK